jgi:hypothetical protein
MVRRCISFVVAPSHVLPELSSIAEYYQRKMWSDLHALRAPIESRSDRVSSAEPPAGSFDDVPPPRLPFFLGSMSPRLACYLVNVTNANICVAELMMAISTRRTACRWCSTKFIAPCRLALDEVVLNASRCGNRDRAKVRLHVSASASRQGSSTFGTNTHRQSHGTNPRVKLSPTVFKS